MADYYPLIARAVAGLEKNTGDARRALYERARTALVAQLRSVSPALSENDVTRERLALEESIRKVEAEAARKAWVDPTQAGSAARVRAPQFPRWEPPAPTADPLAEDEPPSRQRAVRTDGALLRQTATRTGRSIAPAAAASTATAEAPAVLREQRYEADPVLEQPLPEDKEEPAAQPRSLPVRSRPPMNERRSLLDTGVKDFREVVAESEEASEAPARSARDSRMLPAAHDYDRIDSPDPYGDPHGQLQNYPAPSLLEQGPDYEEAAHLPKPRPDVARRVSPGFDFKKIAKSAAAIVLLAGLGSVTAWQWPNIVGVYHSVTAPKPEVAKVEQPKQQAPRKITDRHEQASLPSSQMQPAALSPAPAPTAAVAQKVVLYEEDPNDPQGKRFVGSAIWRTERVPAGPNQQAEVAIRADVEIPDRKLAMTWSLRRNMDASLPATHTVEIMFRLPQDFDPGGVSNVPGILMKATEQTRGVPLAGLAVKVTNGFFLIGLSASEADKERNVQMLKERQWFDIPVVYNNNRRAILAVEKGTPGERVFAEAFAAWRQ
jgi:hypothetical protein